MKKYFIIAVAAIAAMAACSKVDVVDTPAQKVTFQAVPYTAQTKAVSVLNDFESFKCKAYLHAEGIDLNADGTVKTTTTYQKFFGENGETISPDNTTDPTVWAPSHTYYWPKGTQSFVNFAGWYGTTDGSSADSDPTITYAYDADASAYKATLSWDFTNATVGDAGANLLYADMAWRFKSNNNPATYGMDSVTEGVPMLFHPALAQINIKAYASKAAATPANPDLVAGSGKVSDTNAEWVITLENVTITPVYTTGNLSLTNTDPGTAATRQAWTGTGWTGTNPKGNLQRTSNFTLEKVTKETATDVVAATCVIPQDLYVADALDVKLTFDMRIVTTYKTAPANPNTELIHKEISLHAMGTDAWAQNTKYTYYLNIIPSQNKVLFDPALELDWATGSTTDQTI